MTLAAVLCLVALAAADAAIAPKAATSLKPQATNLEMDAITIPRMLSYQGKLTDTLGQPVADTTYSVAFRLYTVPSGGSPFWNETQTVTTKSGLFSVLLGSVTPIGSVPGAGALYLGMAVGGGSEMAPRLRVVSAAYAYKADTANYALAGGTPEYAWVRGSPDSVLYTVNRLGIARGGASNMLYGNYRCTHTNFGVECTTGTSGQDYPYCTVGGGHGNTASDYRATVGGGYGNTASHNRATVGGGKENAASGDYATVGGGQADTAKAVYGGVLSGYSNLAGDASTDTAATVCGGYNNSATFWYAFVGGGLGNTASNPYATVGGGWDNTASDVYATVGGGNDNTASGHGGTIAGGRVNVAHGNYSFATNYSSEANHDYSVAVNQTHTTTSNQLRCGVVSKTGGSFTIDHPLQPISTILNHYFVESPDMSNIYSGSVVLDAAGRAEVNLPDYFDALNRNPRVQLTGVGTAAVVYVAEDVQGNRFTIGGPANTKVYWTVTGDRKDPSAEVIRLIMPVEQPKTGKLAGHSLDDDFLAGTMKQLEEMGESGRFGFRTAEGRAQYQESLRDPAERK